MNTKMNTKMNKKDKKTFIEFLRTSKLTDVFLVIFSVVITVLAVEWVTGGLIFRSKDKGKHSIEFYHKLLTKSRWPLGAHRYHPAMGYELTPSFSGMLGNKKFFLHTHALGYRIPRDADSESFKPGGILALGCSFTFGDGVEAEQAFAYLTAERLGLPGYNYGVCSYSYASVIKQLEELDKKGILKKLEPSVVVLGAGNWLIHRSQGPFFPTRGLQFGYAYIGENENGLDVMQPDDYYSTKHLYQTIDEYFAGSTGRNVKLTEERAAKLRSIMPRIKKANEDKELFKEIKIGPRKLYEFVIRRISAVLKKYDLPLVILWMPRTAEETGLGLGEAVQAFDNVFLVNGLDVLNRNGVEKKHYHRRHPGPEAHKAYAKGIVELIEEKKLAISN